MKIKNRDFLENVIFAIEDMPTMDNFTGNVSVNINVLNGSVTNVKLGNEMSVKFDKKEKKLAK